MWLSFAPCRPGRSNEAEHRLLTLVASTADKKIIKADDEELKSWSIIGGGADRDEEQEDPEEW